MSGLEFRKLGTNPEQEAELLYNLCSSDGIDDAITSEFPGTIAVYSQQPNETSINRIIDRYGAGQPKAIGSIVILGDIAVGLAYSGLAEFQEENDAGSTLGINVSSWLSSHYRGKGFGNHLIAHAVSAAQSHIENPNNSEWYNKKIWTSIRIGNLASVRACENAGFVNSGVMFDDPNRYIYMLQ